MAYFYEVKTTNVSFLKKKTKVSIIQLLPTSSYKKMTYQFQNVNFEYQKGLLL